MKNNIIHPDHSFASIAGAAACLAEQRSLATQVAEGDVALVAVLTLPPGAGAATAAQFLDGWIAVTRAGGAWSWPAIGQQTRHARTQRCVALARDTALRLRA